MGIQKRIIETFDEAETQAFAREFAEGLRAGDVVLLNGDLGAGKSVFSRALIRKLCGRENMEVPSPTFTLVQTYETSDFVIWHFDLYRLSDPSEIYEIGWEEALSGGVLLVEWPERLQGLRPDHVTEIHISTHEDNANKRTIEIKQT